MCGRNKILIDKSVNFYTQWYQDYELLYFNFNIYLLRYILCDMLKGTLPGYF